MAILAQSQPQFLDKLDSEPLTAMEEFYNFLMCLLSVAPPRCYLALEENERRDFVQDFVLDIYENKFVKLRRYRDTGKPFAAWLTVVISNKCLDYLRGRYRTKEKSLSLPIASGDYAQTLRATELTPFEKTAFSTLISAVQRNLDQLSERCRLLIRMAAEETTYADMCRLLNLPQEQNKKLSDQLRHCRKLLKDMLVNEGINLEDWL